MIVSLLLNFVAVLAAQFVISNAFPDSTGQTTRPLRNGVALPQIWSVGGVDLGLPLVVVVVVTTWFVMQRSTFGFSVRAAGAGIRAAELAGLPGRRVTFATFGLAGAFAGLAGALLILGGSGQLSRGISANYGFLGIAVALIAGLRILWVAPAAIVLAALTVGSNSLEVSEGVPRAIGAVLVTLLVVTLLGSRAIGIKASR
jgi:simple sugar transport system permease protein